MDTAIRISGGDAPDKEAVEVVTNSLLSIMVTGKEMNMDQETVRLAIQTFREQIKPGNVEGTVIQNCNIRSEDNNWFVEDADGDE